MNETLEFEAVNLIDRFESVGLTHDEAKQCALICSDEMLKTIPIINNTLQEARKRIYYIELGWKIKEM